MRIALSALAHEGLLDALGGGGFIVRAFTYSEVVDAIELRSVLEGTAARFAAERLVSEDELEPLVTASAALDVVVSDLSSDLVVRYVPLNQSFHTGLVRLAKSPVLERAVANVVTPAVRVAERAARLTRVAAPRSRDAARCPAPAPAADRGDPRAARHPGRGHRARACAARAAESRARARATSRRSTGPPARRCCCERFDRPCTSSQGGRSMSDRSLEDAIRDAGSPVALARHSQLGPYVYPAVPAEFSNWRDEQISWRETCALFDQTHHMTDLLIDGPDAIRLLSDLGSQHLREFRRRTRRSSSWPATTTATSSAMRSSSTWPRTGCHSSDGRRFTTGCSTTPRPGTTTWRSSATSALPSTRPVAAELYRYQVQGPNALDGTATR